MRLFVAADIDDETRAQLASVREAIQHALDRAAIVPRVGWVKDESAHVTLRFIGEVSDTIGESVQEALRQPLPGDAFEVQWSRVGTFPGGRNPRVVWVGCSRGADELAALAMAVDARLAPIVGPIESRPFKAHLTIGRVKEPGKGADWTQALAAASFAPTVTRVDHATLYLSKTSPKGPIYTALRRTNFAGL
jgi:RNA 2',3'-cyclic 3'-phosphodiesterase